VAVAWMAIRYCEELGMGSGREVMVRASGPLTYWETWIPLIVTVSG